MARVVCDIINLDGTPFEGDPRHVLRRALEKARRLGSPSSCAPELEYFYFDAPDPSADVGATAPAPLDRGSYFELTTSDLASDLRRQTVLTLEDMGIPVEYSQHEDAPSQHEIDLRYTDALTMADTVMTVRHGRQGDRRRSGASWPPSCPSPCSACRARGCTPTCRSSTATPTPSTTRPTSTTCRDVARRFIAGLLTHAREITAVTNQWVNSYKRLIIGYEAPVYVSWARNNRSALVRVPPTKRGKKESTRIEYRAPDSAANPYLAFAAILAAGLAGIEQGYELPAGGRRQPLRAIPRAAPGRGHRRPARHPWPRRSTAMERSELMAETLGEHVFEWFIRNKRAEWADYKAEVTAFELRRYLTSL